MIGGGRPSFVLFFLLTFVKHSIALNCVGNESNEHYIKYSFANGRLSFESFILVDKNMTVRWQRFTKTT